MSEINYKMLGSLVREKIQREKLSNLEASRQIETSKSTIWWIQQGRRVSSHHVALFCRWLDITPARLTGREFLTSQRLEGESTLDVIHSLILGDSSLTPDAQQSLSRIMDLGYRLATK